MNLRKIAAILVVAVTIWIPVVTLSTGCKSASVQRKAVNSLYSTHITVDKAYDAYIDLVIEGRLLTNSLPKVAKAYNDYQAAYNDAVVLVAGSTNQVAPTEVIGAMIGVTSAIEAAKKGE